MTNAINSLMCFPPVSWWKNAVHYEKVYSDPNELFRKMTCRNRYRIATANGLLQLSVPIMGGREQRKPMREIKIDNKTDWQKQHWRSVFSAYGRAPFFEHYGPELEHLFRQQYEYLVDFNRVTIDWAAKNLRLQNIFSSVADESFLNTAADLRMKTAQPEEMPVYTQVFEDRYGFMPDLSVLDMLMNEGPAAAVLLSS
jgi:hypothetical protein